MLFGRRFVCFLLWFFFLFFALCPGLLVVVLLVVSASYHILCCCFSSWYVLSVSPCFVCYVVPVILEAYAVWPQ